MNTSHQKFPVHLYVKTHNKTGLKYFGKTVSSDPHKYRGSGRHWIRHLRVHGNDYTTSIVATFTTADGLYEFATTFSRENNIVESTDWANLIIEDGLGGGFAPVSDARKAAQSKESSSRQWYTNGLVERFLKSCPSNWMLGRLPSKVKGKTTSLKGRPMSEEDKAKRRKPHDKTKPRKPNPPKTPEQRTAQSKKRWWKNIATNQTLFSEECPDGFTSGRILHDYDRHPSNTLSH